MLPGVSKATKKNGEVYYRSGITYHNKHISLGSFPSEQEAYAAYLEASRIFIDPKITIDRLYKYTFLLSFDKVICLLNFRDYNMYLTNPIYMRSNYFEYYYSKNIVLKFDIDDLFFYSGHKIQKRGNHLFVSEYGMQTTILSRYGVKPFAVPGRDFLFVNGDTSDYRYSNIEIINPYFGVTKEEKNLQVVYKTQIHICGNYLIGRYSSQEKAAIAYNKAVDLAKDFGIKKEFNQNFIESLSGKEYANLYSQIKISKNYIKYLQEASTTLTSD